MKIENINEVLSNLSEWQLDKKFKVVSESTSPGFHSEKSQGDEGERVKIYDIGQVDIFLKIVFTSDSYGDENGLTSIQFVKPTTKEVTVYE